MNDIKTSVIIRAYNSQNTIERALRSALFQSCPLKSFEVIAVDDGSEDKTPKILNLYKSCPNLVLVTQKNKGAIEAARAGLHKSRGDYVAVLDSDDYFEPNLVKKLSAVLDENPEIDFVYPDYYEEDESGKKKVSPRNIFETVAEGTMFRADKLKKAGFYKRGVLFAEYDLLLRTLDKWKGYHYPEPLFTYARRKESITGRKDWVEKALKQLKELHPDKIGEIKKIRPYSLQV